MFGRNPSTEPPPLIVEPAIARPEFICEPLTMTFCVVHSPELILNQSKPNDEKLPVIEVGALQLI